MITESQVYWITRLDSIRDIAVPVTVFGMLGIVVFVIAMVMKKMAIIDKDTEVADRATVICRLLWPVLISTTISLLILGFLPTTKEMCAIKIIPRIINNEKVQELPNKVVELANEWMEELKPKKGE